MFIKCFQAPILLMEEILQQYGEFPDYLQGLKVPGGDRRI